MLDPPEVGKRSLVRLGPDSMLGARRIVVCVGPIRSGTTWLFEWLRQHPQVAAPRGKEINFFNDNFDRGTDWYLRQFFAGFAQATRLLDVGPHYLDLPDIAERLAQTIVDPLIIVGIRNPYDRVISDYRRHHSGIARLTDLITHPAGWQHYLRTNLIAKSIETLFVKFGRENVIVYNFDELTQSPRTLCEKLCTAIDIVPLAPSGIERKVLASQAPHSRRLLNLARVCRRLAAGVAPRLADDLAFGPLRRLVYSDQPAGTISAQEMKAAFNRCRPFFEAEITALEALLGIDLANWRLAADFDGKRWPAAKPRENFGPRTRAAPPRPLSTRA